MADQITIEMFDKDVFCIVTKQNGDHKKRRCRHRSKILKYLRQLVQNGYVLTSYKPILNSPYTGTIAMFSTGPARESTASRTDHLHAGRTDEETTRWLDANLEPRVVGAGGAGNTPRRNKRSRRNADTALADG